MKKSSTVHAFRNEIFKEQKLTIGLDLGMCVAAFGGHVYNRAFMFSTSASFTGFDRRKSQSCSGPGPPVRF